MPGFRLQPRTVWGTRRWFLGREMVYETMSMEDYWTQTQGMSMSEYRFSARAGVDPNDELGQAKWGLMQRNGNKWEYGSVWLPCTRVMVAIHMSN